MDKFNVEEVKSKTLDRFMSPQSDPEPQTLPPLENTSDVVQLPKIQEEVQELQEEQEPEQEQEYDNELPEYLQEEQCVPMIGKINKRPEIAESKPSGLFGGKGTFVLYGLMGLGLASQLLK